jgi:TolA-binding protein
VTTALPIGAATFGALPISYAQASPESTDLRLRRIEAELRAVQRKVFPDGAGKTFGPEIVPAAGTAPAAAPATTAVTDLLTRMDAVEVQLQRLTAASEENQNQVNKLEARLAALEAAASPPAAVASTPAAASSPPASGPTVLLPKPADETPKPLAKPPAKPVAQSLAKPESAKSDPPADRVAAVMAIEKPASNDKGEDEYLYGYRLWEAKFFPEAQQQLLRVVQQFSKHERISYARNLLGRAYLDDGKPGTAAQYFLQNYQADRKGDRAADSLLYLGVAMGRLKEEKRACVAFSEFRQTYPAEMVGRLKNQYEAAIKPVTCN